MSDTIEMIKPEIGADKWWYQLDYDWHRLKIIPFEIFQTVLVDYIETNKSDLNECMFRKKRPYEILT